MKLELNAEEIIEVACQIERDGGEFYRKAAEMVEDPGVQQLLTDLALLESEHEITFENMRANPDILSKLLGDPQSEACMYLRALAQGHIFSSPEKPLAKLKSSKNIEETLKIAIDLELKSIAFYQGFREVMDDSSKVNKLDDIIREEMRHVVILNEKLRHFTG